MLNRMYPNRLLGFLLAFLGFGVLVYWGLFIAGGGMTHGLRTVDGSNYIALHQLAEVVMALISLTAGLRLVRAKRGGRELGLVACGLLLYSGINSMGWSLRNDQALSVIFVVTILVSAYGIATLARASVTAQRP